jgi:hypothetical protein
MSASTYSNLDKPDPDEIVTRYTSLAQFIWILTQKELPLIRIDRFRDPFEGSAPKSLMDLQLIITSSRSAAKQQQRNLQHFYPESASSHLHFDEFSEDLSEKTKRARKARTFSTHASCWRWGRESEGMWRLYCGEEDGVALQTTFARLQKSVDQPGILVGKVRYIDYKTETAFNQDLDHVMHKRLGFDFEQEVRVLRTDDEYYRKLCNQTASEKLPCCIPIPWNLAEVIEHILISPYADEWYVDAVRAAADLPGMDIADGIVWSELRDQPQF